MTKTISHRHADETIGVDNDPEGTRGTSRWQKMVGVAILALVALVGCAAPDDNATRDENPGAKEQPYAGLQDRPIKALAPERVADLLAGRGATLALAAELNHFPGPRHVLEFATELELTASQAEAARQASFRMDQRAKELGRQVIEQETELDKAFGDNTITASQLELTTSRIAAIEAKLREVHLTAHLEMKQVLTSEQVARYDQLRGYGSRNPPAPGDTLPKVPRS